MAKHIADELTAAMTNLLRRQADASRALHDRFAGKTSTRHQDALALLGSNRHPSLMSALGVHRGCIAWERSTRWNHSDQKSDSCSCSCACAGQAQRHASRNIHTHVVRIASHCSLGPRWVTCK
jgi:hypothetical protein